MKEHHKIRFPLRLLLLAVVAVVLASLLVGEQDSLQTASPDGTVVFHQATRIVDEQGNIWTINGNAVLENGQIIATTPQLIELLYAGGKVYIKFKDKGISVWNVWNETTSRVDRSASHLNHAPAGPLATGCLPKSKAKN
jgi:hypothetical protein